MTYDPSRGSSTYLGMEGDSIERSQVGARDGRVAGSARSAESVSRRVTSSQPSGPRDVPATIRRPSQAPRRGVAPVAPVTPGLPHQTVRPQPSPEQQRPIHEGAVVRRSGRGARALAVVEGIAFHLVALMLRAVALVLAGLVVCSVFLTGSARASLVNALNLTPLLVPANLLGRFVAETPFGGVFRGDLAIASIILFCADWICMRFSTSLLYGRERGA